MNFDFHLRGNRFSKSPVWRFEWGTGELVKMHRFNAFSRNVNTINLKMFPTHDGMASIQERDKILRSLKKYERMYP